MKASRENPIFLAQSDTTIGFLCADFQKLNAIKGRSVQTNTLVTLDSLEKLKRLVRIPNAHKKRIRRSSRTTFIYRGKNAIKQARGTKESLEGCLSQFLKSLAIRVVQQQSKRASHAEFLRFFPYLYSTSANKHKESFVFEFALENADVIVLDARLFSAQTPSKIYKISNLKISRIR